MGMLPALFIAEGLACTLRAKAARGAQLVEGAAHSV